MVFVIMFFLGYGCDIKYVCFFLFFVMFLVVDLNWFFGYGVYFKGSVLVKENDVWFVFVMLVVVCFVLDDCYDECVGVVGFVIFVGLLVECDFE